MTDRTADGAAKQAKAEGGISRDAIVRTAVELLGEHGLQAVSLRRIATELGITAPTLYWYVKSKRELLDLVAEHLLRSGRASAMDLPESGQPWWEWLRARTRLTYDQMVRVRDAPQVIAGNRPQLVTLGQIDKSLGALIDAGFRAEKAQQLFFVLGAYVGGMALEAQSEVARAATTDDSQLMTSAKDLEEFPNLAMALRSRVAFDGRATFDYGLDLILRGARADLEGRFSDESESPAAGQGASLGESGG